MLETWEHNKVMVLRKSTHFFAAREVILDRVVIPNALDTTSLQTADLRRLQVATLWGAKGVTAEHIYILGVCREALPGQRRDEYPGTDADYRDEQRRLFYVSITRARKTLVISRALRVGRGRAKRLGLTVTTGSKFWADLKMSPFLHDIMDLLPTAVPGDYWSGCVPP